MFANSDRNPAHVCHCSPTISIVPHLIRSFQVDYNTKTKLSELNAKRKQKPTKNLPCAAKQVHSFVFDEAHLAASCFRRFTFGRDQTPSVRHRIETIQIVKMLLQNTVVPAEHVQHAIVHERRMTTPSDRNRARRIRRMPHARLQIQIDNFRTINLLLRMVRTLAIATSTEHVHSIQQNGGRVKVSIAGRRLFRHNVPPSHRFQVQTVHVPTELADLLFETAENVHVLSDDTGRMAVTYARYRSVHGRLRPTMRAGVEAKENVATRFVVATAPHVHFVLVRDGRVSVPLKGHFRIPKRLAFVVFFRLHQEPT